MDYNEDENSDNEDEDNVNKDDKLGRYSYGLQ